MKIASTVAALVSLTLFGSSALAGVAVGNPGKLIDKSRTTNSLVPVAGVNQSAPLASASRFNVSKSHYSTLPYGLMYEQGSRIRQQSPGFINKDPGAGVIDPDDCPSVIDPDAEKWTDCPPYEPCDDAAFYEDGAFLPWHRG
jgi:hypothetical protein